MRSKFGKNSKYGLYKFGAFLTVNDFVRIRLDIFINADAIGLLVL